MFIQQVLAITYIYVRSLLASSSIKIYICKATKLLIRWTTFVYNNTKHTIRFDTSFFLSIVVWWTNYSTELRDKKKIDSWHQLGMMLKIVVYIWLLWKGFVNKVKVPFDALIYCVLCLVDQTFIYFPRPGGRTHARDIKNKWQLLI